MRTDIPADVTTLLRTAPWLDEPLRRGTFRVLDQAVLGPSRLLVVAPADGAARYFVPVLDADPGREATRTDDHDRAVVQALRDGLRLPTAAGNVVEFDGGPPPYRGPLPFAPGWSSNALSLVDLGGAAHVHKAYRRMSAGTREPRMMRLMGPGGRTQRWVGDYHYVERDTGRRLPLGVVYAYADGDGLDLPLRHSIRAMWPLLADGVDVTEAVDTVQRGLVDRLPGAGRFLRAFHDELADRLGPAPDFPAERFVAETAARVARLSPLILADDRHPGPVRAAVAAALADELDRQAAAAPGSWPSGATHGDLHLSHFLRAETGAGWRMCLIDLSTPAVDPADPDRADQSPWQDLVSLLRGLEIFTADEFAHQAAIELDVDGDETCRTALLVTAGHPPDTAGWTADRLAVLRRSQAAAQLWARRVRRLLIAGYADPGTEPERQPAWRMFRLRRLVHELDYAYAHDMPYHAAINLRHALETLRPATGEG
ncbi:hypothetical protein AB0I61_11105 [Polymorphospora rubra]|uniref:hypothetical protein n=1 Tax=Polymorphospora rubra TaxID=338584 RepID=UPI0033DB469D